MQITITFSGEITYTHEHEETSVGGNVTSLQDVHSTVLEGVTLTIEVEEPEEPVSIAKVFESLIGDVLSRPVPFAPADDDEPIMADGRP